MLNYVVPIVSGAIAGGLVAGLTLWLYLRSRSEAASVEPLDPWVAAELDQAAAQWATEQGRPEAAGLLADKLRLLHRLGASRRRS